MLSCRFFLIFLLFPLHTYAIELSSPNYIANKYLTYTANHKTDLSAIIHKGQVERTTLEILILKSALELGGMVAKISFNVAPTEGRIMMNLINGTSLIAGPVWSDEIDPRLYASNAILRKNEVAGLIYGLPTNTKLLQVRTLTNLRKFIGVRVLHWKRMEERMNSLGLKSTVAVDRPAIFKLIHAHRGGFAFMFPGQGDDMAQTHNNIRLLPIPNVKLNVAVSSHYVVSKTHPQGKNAITALNKGLAKLREKGEISRVFTITGVIDERIKNWIALD